MGCNTVIYSNLEYVRTLHYFFSYAILDFFLHNSLCNGQENYQN